MIRASPSLRSLLRGALVRAALVVTSLGVFFVLPVRGADHVGAHELMDVRGQEDRPHDEWQDDRITPEKSPGADYRSSAMQKRSFSVRMNSCPPATANDEITLAERFAVEIFR